jgi:hypothetical protein
MKPPFIKTVFNHSGPVTFDRVALIAAITRIGWGVRSSVGLRRGFAALRGAAKSFGSGIKPSAPLQRLAEPA